MLLETLAQTSLKSVQRSWIEALQKTIDRTAIAVRFQAVRTASALQVSALDEKLNRIGENSDEPAVLRVEALRAVVQRHPRLSASAFNLLVEQLRGRGDPVSRLAAAEVLRRSQLSDAQMLAAVRAVRGDALIYFGQKKNRQRWPSAEEECCTRPNKTAVRVVSGPVSRRYKFHNRDRLRAPVLALRSSRQRDQRGE